MGVGMVAVGQHTTIDFLFQLFVYRALVGEMTRISLDEECNLTQEPVLFVDEPAVNWINWMRSC
jgi:hypothetical protein